MMTPNALLIPARPDALQYADCARLKFLLEFSTPCLLQPAVFLGLGRLLRLASRQTPGGRELFSAGLSDDPVAQRRHQKPSPPYVVRMPLTRERQVDAGEQLELEVLFLGTSIPLIRVFIASLEHLGRLGLVEGEGQFEVLQAVSIGPDLAEDVLWRHGDACVGLMPVVVPLDWWLETQMPPQAPLTLNFTTPARLMVGGRPLRRPHFVQVFPFILRRVTSMLHACCGLEPVGDPRLLLQTAGEVEELSRELEWQDWRPLANRGQSVGGFVGRMHLGGAALDEILWVLAVGTLFGVGKSASHGAGALGLSA